MGKILEALARGHSRRTYKYEGECRLLQLLCSSFYRLQVHTMASQRSSFLVRIRQQLVANVILHYDPTSRDLRAWFW